MKLVRLHGKNAEGRCALVEDGDYAQLRKFKWYVGKNGYCYARKQSSNVETHYYMHRVVMQAPSGTLVDHINRNPLDNRRVNLRLCSFKQNNTNGSAYNKHSRYKGVRYRYGRWYARITVNHVGYHLGSFATEQDAAIAYNQAALKHFGEFAGLNVVPA